MHRKLFTPALYKYLMPIFRQKATLTLQAYDTQKGVGKGDSPAPPRGKCCEKTAYPLQPLGHEDPAKQAPSSPPQCQSSAKASLKRTCRDNWLMYALLENITILLLLGWPKSSLELTPPKDVLFITGDWNAEVGSQETPGVTGKFSFGVQNEAGQRLIEFCQKNALVIANTVFQQHKRRLYTWTSPDGQHQNQIDYICSKRWRSSIQSAKTRPGADCGSDHEFLIAKFRLKLKKVGKTTRPFRYDLNQIPYDYIVEVRNRFKGLDLIDRVPDELGTEVCDTV